MTKAIQAWQVEVHRAENPMEELLQLIGERISKGRKHLSLTQEQLAERADLNLSYIGQIERALRTPSLKSLLKISRALNIPLAQLLDEEHNNPFENPSPSLQERIRFVEEVDIGTLQAAIEILQRLETLRDIK